MEIFQIIVFTSTIVTIIYVVLLNKKIQKGNTSNELLSTKEKILTIILGIVGPLVNVNLIMYYGLRKKYPEKAKLANKLGWITIPLVFVINVILATI
ncbi:hypothetical protein HN670_01720 [bacterium]|jgi:hypothetical protein|nr:hypothetical protein [bacterium]MBT4722734.1 hypothetical protein [Candidatus Falkowbacteria bacterium]MBT7553165.1 hypothetical protein [bacterium]